MEDLMSEWGQPECTGRGSPDRLLELLADEHRRAVVEHLRESTEPVAVADLARYIADLEQGRSSATGPGQGESVLVSLHHCHVPKLADTDVVDYDHERNTVERGADFDRIAALWEALPDDGDPDRE